MWSAASGSNSADTQGQCWGLGQSGRCWRPAQLRRPGCPLLMSSSDEADCSGLSTCRCNNCQWSARLNHQKVTQHRKNRQAFCLTFTHSCRESEIVLLYGEIKSYLNAVMFPLMPWWSFIILTSLHKYLVFLRVWEQQWEHLTNMFGNMRAHCVHAKSQMFILGTGVRKGRV